MSAYDGPDRRAARRAPARLEAAYEDAQRQIFLQTADLSERGVFLVAPDPPQTGVRARVTLEIPGQSALLRLSGSVTRRVTEGRNGFAIHFDPEGVGSSERDALRAFVDRQIATE